MGIRTDTASNILFSLHGTNREINVDTSRASMLSGKDSSNSFFTGQDDSPGVGATLSSWTAEASQGGSGGGESLEITATSPEPMAARLARRRR